MDVPMGEKHISQITGWTFPFEIIWNCVAQYVCNIMVIGLIGPYGYAHMKQKLYSWNCWMDFLCSMFYGIV